ncbi:MAG: helix-turn-helix domain-containing protein [Anaerostipes hadrus]
MPLSVSKASISQYLNGSHAPSNISSGKMAKILNVNPVWLMGFDVPMQEKAVVKK